MTRPIHTNANYYDKQEVSPSKLCRDQEPSLLGCTVIPTDGSYVIGYKDGKLRHESIAYQPAKHKWLVIAENCVLPTGYHYHEEPIGVQPTSPNSIILQNPDDPNEIAFSRPKFVHVVSRPQPQPSLHEIMEHLRKTYPNTQFQWNNNVIEIIN